VTSALFASTAGSRFVFTAGEAGYGFHLEVLDAGAWRRVTAPATPSWTGTRSTFVPAWSRPASPGWSSPDHARTSPAANTRGTATVVPVAGTAGSTSRSRWTRTDSASGEHRSVEPQISVNLGGLPPYERGDHVWFKTLVENPTQWNSEGQGNDFPALYYYDPYLRTQFRMFFDMTAMSWMGKDTIARFYNYSCAFRRLYDGEPSAEIGLLAHSQSGHDFPAGRQVFSWYLSADLLESEPTPPSEQDALQNLVGSCLPLLRSSTGYWPEHSTSWADFADGCATI